MSGAEERAVKVARGLTKAQRKGAAFDHLLSLAGGSIGTLERAIVACDTGAGEARFHDVEQYLLAAEVSP